MASHARRSKVPTKPRTKPFQAMASAGVVEGSPSQAAFLPRDRSADGVFAPGRAAPATQARRPAGQGLGKVSGNTTTPRMAQDEGRPGRGVAAG